MNRKTKTTRCLTHYFVNNTDTSLFLSGSVCVTFKILFSPFESLRPAETLACHFHLFLHQDNFLLTLCLKLIDPFRSFSRVVVDKLIGISQPFLHRLLEFTYRRNGKAKRQHYLLDESFSSVVKTFMSVFTMMAFSHNLLLHHIWHTIGPINSTLFLNHKVTGELV